MRRSCEVKEEISGRMFQHGKIGQEKSVNPLGYGVIKGITYTKINQGFSKG